MQRVAVAIALLALLTTSSYAQTTDFFELVKTGTPHDVQAALDKGADVNAKDKDDCTALMYAAESNANPGVITTLLTAGADINARDTEMGRTALIWAVHDNLNPEVITVLLKAGADTKLKDKAGYTAFGYAQFRAMLKDTDALKQLEEASK